MEARFSERCLELYQLHESLILKGFKNKNLARSIGLYPSAYSVLIKRIIHPISELHQKNKADHQKIKDIFAAQSNISEQKTRQKIHLYLDIFRELNTEDEEDAEKTFDTNLISHFLNNTPVESLKLLEGIYYCYYLSTSGYKIKKEPFLIFLDKKNGFYKVMKGNDLGTAKYKGFAYVSNGELFTVHLQEQDTFTKDHFIIHLHLPLTYSFSINLLQGVAISLANNKMPIARKLVLERFDKKPDRQKFNEMKTVFFENTEKSDSDIANYLSGVPNVIDYMNIPYPTYNTEDLAVEKEVRKLSR